MGQQSSTEFEGMASRLQASNIGKLQLTGRYHLLPQRLEDQYVVQEKTVLGSGYNGAVVLATSKASSTNKYAVKCFKLDTIAADKRGQLESEIEVFLLMDHPHVARLHDVYEEEGKLQLVMECMEGGELFDRVTELKRFSELDCANCAYQMLLALNYIHTQGIVHRDLKLENFLYEKKGGDHLKLIDFGFSKVWNPSAKMRVSCGTLSYVAPEVLEKNYTSQCDLWSLGVIVFILLSGYMPFSGSDATQTRNISKGIFKMKPERWGSLSAEATEFTKQLITVDASVRLTAKDALAHPFIANRKTREAPAIDTGIVDALRNFGHASRFRRCCMEMLAWSLTTEERAQIRQYFISMDENKEGTITLGEFRRVLVDKFHIADEEMTQIFNAMDTNHDEEIHYSNFLAAVMSTRVSFHEELLRSAFSKFDTDSSGYITLENLRHVLGDTYEGEDVQNFINEADLLHDGRISYPEFVSFVKQTPLEEFEGSPMSRMLDRQIAESASSSSRKVSMSRRKSSDKSVTRSKSFQRIAQVCERQPCVRGVATCCIA